MTEVKMLDIYQSKVEVSRSASGFFRMDFSGESFPQRTHPKTGEDIPTCISLPYSKAKILYAVLAEYIEEAEENE